MKNHLSGITRLLLLVSFFFVKGMTVRAQEITPFVNNDRVVFLGNSITDGGHYHSYIGLYYMTRFPAMNLSVLNAGIGGDRVIEMVKRLDGDVFSKQPTVLITTFGMNDSGYFEYNGSEPDKFADEKVKESYDAYQEMEKRYKQLPDTRIVLMGSSPYDEEAIIKDNTPFKGKNKAMLRIVDFQKASAQANNWEFFDLNQPMTQLNQRIQQQDSTFTLCGADRIHPDNDGHMVMAYLFLKAQGFAGNKVAELSIDAARQQVVSAVNCQASTIKKTAAGISVDYKANSLPYPLDTVARGWGSKKSQYDALRVIPFMEEMNQEQLVVTGLKGRTQLVIDGEVIGIWSADDFAHGINLAALTNTPQYQQALGVMYLNEERWEIERRFRDYAWVQYNFFQPRGLLDANNRKAINVMDEHVATDGWLRAKRDLYARAMLPEVRKSWQDQIDQLTDAMREAAIPKTRKITLVSVQ
ncbi:SGNH/GDSL hydrolase family protein [Parapedobacter indicus]|uniref:Lysophospholipase L1 n=1 Tax=Parapedobacter indicus TaxID=1477437 RepID=A0A1I3D3R6_9SPHI|nr:SGNH/GDSL hydrolase family protein [Parapedobacter indicus]PPL04514.1 lysophospholipase L1-like esterase [Parapedobacter indicus]SFH81337.1 Lysophospholipase L1 [Parapedobacter indicus]